LEHYLGYRGKVKRMKWMAVLTSCLSATVIVPSNGHLERGGRYDDRSARIVKRWAKTAQNIVRNYIFPSQVVRVQRYKNTLEISFTCLVSSILCWTLFCMTPYPLRLAYPDLHSWQYLSTVIHNGIKIAIVSWLYGPRAVLNHSVANKPNILAGGVRSVVWPISHLPLQLTTFTLLLYERRHT
jgi:uncharacterized protein with PQ loop repeat